MACEYPLPYVLTSYDFHHVTITMCTHWKIATLIRLGPIKTDKTVSEFNFGGCAGLQGSLFVGAVSLEFKWVQSTDKIRVRLLPRSGHARELTIGFDGF